MRFTNASNGSDPIRRRCIAFYVLYSHFRPHLWSDPSSRVPFVPAEDIHIHTLLYLCVCMCVFMPVDKQNFVRVRFEKRRAQLSVCIAFNARGQTNKIIYARGQTKSHGWSIRSEVLARLSQRVDEYTALVSSQKYLNAKGPTCKHLDNHICMSKRKQITNDRSLRPRWKMIIDMNWKVDAQE